LDALSLLRILFFAAVAVFGGNFLGAADGRTLRTLDLCEDHPAVLAARRVEAPRFEGGPFMASNGRSCR